MKDPHGRAYGTRSGNIFFGRTILSGKFQNPLCFHTIMSNSFIFYVYFILSIYSSGEEQIKEISNSNIKSHVDPRCNSGAGEQAAPG